MFFVGSEMFFVGSEKVNSENELCFPRMVTLVITSLLSDVMRALRSSATGKQRHFSQSICVLLEVPVSP